MVASKYNLLLDIEGKEYLFNLASQCLISCDHDLVDFLNGNQEIRLSKGEETSLYENGIIVDSHEFEVSRLKSNISSLKFDKTKMAAFISTTSACNLNCTYCYQDIRKELNCKKYMTESNWKVVIEYFKNEIKKYNTKLFAVSLFGGEPMFNDSMCQQIITDLRRLEDIFPELVIQCVLITNGTLFNESNIKFYLDNIDNIQITLDGIKEINDSFRIYPNGEGSFDKIISSLKLIKKHKTSDILSTICLRINVNKETVNKSKELIDYLIDKNLTQAITSIKFHEIFGTQGEIILDGNDERDNDIELAKEIVKLNYYLIENGIKVFKEISGLCIGKLANGYTVDEQLNIYACPGLLYSDVHGKISTDGKLIIDNKKWYDYHLEEAKCINFCKYAPICYGGCTWAKGENEKDCMRDIFDATLVDKLKTYIISQYI